MRIREVDNEVEAHLCEIQRTVRGMRDDCDYYQEEMIRKCGFIVEDARNLRRIIYKERAARLGGSSEKEEVEHFEALLSEIQDITEIILGCEDSSADAMKCCTDMLESSAKLERILGTKKRKRVEDGVSSSNTESRQNEDEKAGQH